VNGGRTDRRGRPAGQTGTKGSGSGQFTGSAVQTPFGTVQVQVTMQNGTITDVQALQLPSGRGHTQQVSAVRRPAAPKRGPAGPERPRRNTISGATYTSEGYMQSLQSALDQAKA
jgi:uncharacterized protein with FMN-binding domain